jgi:hypothetical protein
LYSLIYKKKLIIRIRRASLNEIISRIREALLIWRLTARYKKKQEVSPQCHLSNHEVQRLRLPDFSFETDKKIIKKILNGQVYNLNFSIDEQNTMHAEINGAFFSKIKIDRLFSDIRLLWESARLQNLTTLLAYVNKHPDDCVSEAAKNYCAEAVLDWINSNPFLFGPHYLSVMECGLRIPVFFYCLKVLDNLTPTQIKIILKAIYLHAWWISKRLSLYSSSGNHTIAESVGLIFAGSIFSNDFKCRNWLKQSIYLLEKELHHQVFDDGGPVEQSFQYHRFVLDLYWLAINYLEINNLHDCHNFKKRLISAEKFLYSFKTSRGNIPSIGDSDDGHAVAPDIAPRKPECIPRKKDITIYKQTGYTIVRAENDSCLVFDHGPLGMPPLYAHGHADALSITLSKDDNQIIVDSGTYRYNGENEWRRYFRGTRAHNTVTIDCLDQAIQETEFIWSRPYHTKLLGFSEHKNQFFINAIHNGYARLKEPVLHRRDILFCLGNCFLIKDSFQGGGEHQFELNFHLHPKVHLNKLNGWWQISNQGSTIYLRLFEEDDFLIISGQEKPINGWYSPHYGKKIKSKVLTCQKSGNSDEVYFVTAICTEFPPSLKIIEEKQSFFV